MSQLLDRLDRVFVDRSRNSVLLAALLLAIGVGVASRFTAADLLVLYLIPVFIASWYGGHRAGTVVAVYSAGAPFVINTVADGKLQFDGIAVTNLFVRLVTFMLLANVFSRLRASNRQREELTGFIVHDLRSPIASTITGLQTLDSMSEGMDELQKEMVDLSLVSSQRALTLVTSILDVRKLESGKMEVHKEMVDLPRFADTCLAEIALWAKGGDVELVAKVPEGEGWFDPQLTPRVVVNLLSNALKFSPPGSQVILHIHPAKDGLRFGVIDHGPGIPPEYVDTIFEPFSQVKGTKSGTGLGLSFCRLAVLAQGGRIWVESHLGRGTTMHFTLPNKHD